MRWAIGWPLKKHGDRPLLGADDRRVLNYETVILRRPARNVMRLARLIAMVSMSRSTFLSEAKITRGIKVQRVKKITLNTITHFVFFVIKGVSLDIDRRVTLQFFPARALTPHRKRLRSSRHGVGSGSYRSLNEFTPPGHGEKISISRSAWSAKAQPISVR